MTRQRPSWSED